MDRHQIRTVAAVAMSLVALVLAGLLLSAEWGLTAEYGSGGQPALLIFSPIPLLAGVLAVSLAGWRRGTVAGLVVLTLVVVGGLPVAGAVGQRTKEARAEQADARFTCNGRNAELPVPPAVDAAWHEVDHPAPYWLYGPVEGTRSSCTAGVSGDGEDAFRAWRESMLRSGWRVVEDGDAAVTVQDGGRRAVLRRAGGLTTLTMTTGTGTCPDPSPSQDRVVVGC